MVRYLDFPALTALRNCLQGAPVAGVELDAHLEAYSLKLDGHGKKEEADLEAAMLREHTATRARAASFSLSNVGTPDAAGMAAAEGGSSSAYSERKPAVEKGLNLEDPGARKTLACLIALLNSSWPDYDFRCAA